VTYFCSIGSQILYIFETHGIGQTPSSLERYLVTSYDHFLILVKLHSDSFPRKIVFQWHFLLRQTAVVVTI